MKFELMKAIEDAKTQLASQGVHTVIAQFVDIHGSAKGKYIPLAHLQDVIENGACLLYTSPSPRDRQKSRMPSSA